ncbi:MAG TPA: PilN domain-containing protein [Gemmatimonadaceae bacterium]|nr:PilN domain-containing protein [Gemmatimonadaceae bacterium]
MIEINLLPGTGKKTRSRGVGLNLSGSFAGAISKITDPYMIGAAAAVAISLLATTGLFWAQRAKELSVNEKLQKAEQDSIRFATVIREKRKAQAQRDSVVRQVEMIRGFDNKRFVWPHIMDEVSRAMPPYTWLTSMIQTNTIVAAAQTTPNDPKAAPVEPDSVNAVPDILFRVVGNTVDIQALTRFMKVLEASPFIENVQLVKSTMVMVEGKEVTEFQLDARYQWPDSSAIRTQPVALSVR